MILATPLAMLAAAACIEVSSPMILAGHLKTVVPELAAVGDSIEFGFAPLPGATRHIQRSRLIAFALSNGASIHSAPDICVVRSARILNGSELEAAIRKRVEECAPGTRPVIDILDHTRLPVPDGMIVFPPSDLRPSPEGVSVWRGRVLYDRNRSVPIWVKARVLADGVPFDPQVRSMRQAGASGGPPAVKKGDTLRVTSQSGAVRIVVEASALNAGRIGEVVEMQTRTNRNRIRARITAPGEALAITEEKSNEANGAGDVAGGATHTGARQARRQEADAP